MTHEIVADVIDIACQIATERNKAITVLKVNNVYYAIDAFEWINGSEFIGEHVITVEPGQNPFLRLLNPNYPIQNYPV